MNKEMIINELFKNSVRISVRRGDCDSRTIEFHNGGTPKVRITENGSSKAISEATGSSELYALTSLSRPARVQVNDIFSRSLTKELLEALR